MSTTARDVCEVKRCLPITTALVHTRWILGDHPRKKIQTIQVRGRASVGDGASRDQSVGGGPSRGVERVKSARPPIAPPIRICAEVEEHIDHRRITGVRHDRR